MGEIFDKRLKEVSNMKTYSKRKQRALDDLATAYLQDGKPLDEGLHEVNKIKKSLRATGYSQQEIEDFLIERSYIGKTSLRKYYHESIYNEDYSLKKVVECVPAFHTDKNLTDLIIEEIKSRPKLLRSLKNNASKQYLSQKLNINQPALLKDFYAANKDIIDID
jgi:hypothetical protein